MTSGSGDGANIGPRQSHAHLRVGCPAGAGYGHGNGAWRGGCGDRQQSGPMTELIDAATHQKLAGQLFNRCWDLLETEPRDDVQNRELLTAALTSRFHWQTIGTEENLAVCDWMASRAFAAVGDGRAAVDFANAALTRAEGAGLGDWVVASMYEGLARAHAAAGDRASRDVAYARAERAVAAINDAEDRELIASQLATVP